MIELLVVCTANVCRSPMAEALLRREIERRGLQDSWRVASAGTWARSGGPASEFSVLEMADRGLDISAHRSQLIIREQIARAAVVFVMTRSHREAITVEFPEHARKILLLSEMGGGEYDIDDPYGGRRGEYAECARQLEELIVSGFDWLQRVVSERSG